MTTTVSGFGLLDRWLRMSPITESGHLGEPPVNAAGAADYLTLEARARIEIDEMLEAAWWSV